MSEHGTIRIPGYTLLRSVGSGGMAEVYLATQARLLPQLRRTAHGRVGAASGGGSVWPAPGAAMGAELSVPVALAVRQQA